MVSYHPCLSVGKGGSSAAVDVVTPPFLGHPLPTHTEKSTLCPQLTQVGGAAHMASEISALMQGPRRVSRGQ